jgi:hypothetical protein
MKSFYRTSLVKRKRRTKADLENLLAWVNSILESEEGQMTIRHLFYRLVGAEVIPKTEQAYKQLCSKLSRWRRKEKVSWAAFSDSTRWHIKPETFDSMFQALDNTVATYRRNLWATQKIYVEVWVEKDAMAGIVSRAAEPFGVPVFVARGFASLSSLYSAAETFKLAIKAGKRVIVYHFGDHDPSGVEAGESMVRAFRDDFKVEVGFYRAAVTREHIKRFNLPTRPTKESNHSRNWRGGDSVELDAMPTPEIRKLVEGCITQHIDQREWQALKQTEELEKGTLKIFSDSLQSGALADFIVNKGRE